MAAWPSSAAACSASPTGSDGEHAPKVLLGSTQSACGALCGGVEAVITAAARPFVAMRLDALCGEEVGVCHSGSVCRCRHRSSRVWFPVHTHRVGQVRMLGGDIRCAPS